MSSIVHGSVLRSNVGEIEFYIEFGSYICATYSSKTHFDDAIAIQNLSRTSTFSRC
jgi:hypothetical protein